MEDPKYLAVAAVSIDGKIAQYPGQSSNWTSAEDKNFLHDILDNCDGIIVGRTTYEVAKDPLSKRNCLVLTRTVQSLERKNDRCWLFNADQENLSEQVKKLGWSKVVVLGGAKTYGTCLQQGLVDEIYLTIEPLVFGQGLPLFESDSDHIKNFRLVSVKTLNTKGTILLHYKTLLQ